MRCAIAWTMAAPGDPTDDGALYGRALTPTCTVSTAGDLGLFVTDGDLPGAPNWIAGDVIGAVAEGTEAAALSSLATQTGLSLPVVP